MTRLFVAVWPTDEVIEELRALPRKDMRGVRFVDPDNWHVTLRFLGDADPDDVAACLDRLTSPARTATIGPGVDVLNERTLVVPVSGVDDLAREVVDLTCNVTDEPTRRFRGHLTVARLAKGAAMPRALGMFLDAAFKVTEVALVQSRLRPDGAVYDTVATWALTPAS